MEFTPKVPVQAKPTEQPNDPSNTQDSQAGSLAEAATANMAVTEQAGNAKNGEHRMVRGLRGLYAPSGFSKPDAFNILTDEFLFYLPAALCRGSDSSSDPLSLVLFEDGGLAIRKGDSLYACDVSCIRDGIITEMADDTVARVGVADFIITGYMSKISD